MVKKTPRRVEAAIQRNYVAWVKENYPQVIINATANEHSRKHMSEGHEAGITDILLFARDADGVVHILMQEMKTKKGKLSKSQKNWHENRFIPFLEGEYTMWVVSYGFVEAKKHFLVWAKNLLTP